MCAAFREGAVDCLGKPRRGMKRKFIPIWGSDGARPLTWVGPSQNILPEARGHLRAGGEAGNNQKAGRQVQLP